MSVVFGGLQSKVYNYARDHVLVNNHAVLMLSQFDRTLLLLADLDEFFVPRVSISPTYLSLFENPSFLAYAFR